MADPKVKVVKDDRGTAADGRLLVKETTRGNELAKGQDDSKLHGFEIEVELDASTKAALAREKERVAVHLALYDSAAARPEFSRSWDGVLDAQGGVLHVPPQSLVPGPKGHTLKVALVNVTSARESAKDNLLDCGLWEGKLEEIPNRITIKCTLIR
ncbi:MAG: hypothetical protein MJD61_20440 [Proteobacteria bacterium]|nr:hypothetical protein [Pseudomonadota bacterium]